MKETDIQNKIRIALSAHGVVLRLNNGVFVTQDGRYIKSGLPPGVSDLQFIGENRVAFIEVKTPDGRLTPEQSAWIARMRQLGHAAGVARSVEDALILAGIGD